MATSVKFEGFTSTLHPPKALLGGKQEGKLYAFKDGQQVVSCWRLTEAELKEVAATGVVWLAIRDPEGPPALVSGSALVNVGNRPAKASPA